MATCSCDDQYLTSPPPGFTNANMTLKREQLIELLQKLIDKCQQEPLFITQQPKQTDLLINIAQLTLLSVPISSTDQRDFLNNIMTIGQDLLTDRNSSIDSCLPSNENTISFSTNLPSNITTNDVDGEFSLDDLANEYLQNEPTPSSLNDKPIISSESEELDLTVDNLSKTSLSCSPSTPITNDVLSGFLSPPPSTESILIKPPLESILFSNRLSSNDAADDADTIWKEESSRFGQMFCKKTNEIDSIITKRISTCLLDRSLYERLTRLIILLPKQCIRNSVQQSTIRHNEQPHRLPPSSSRQNNNEHRRQSNRPSFQQNSSQPYMMPRYQNAQNPRPYSNLNYSNQQGNPNGYFVDRRQQQQQQQNRYPPSFAPYTTDQQYQQKGPPPKNNSYHNGQQQQQQQKKTQQTNNQQASNQYQQQQRGTKKGSSGGNKTNGPGSGSNVNPK